MADQDTASLGHTYRIGAVSRLTGVPADTLRVWERRYAVVAPVRSDSGARLYGQTDVSRLTLIKRLVDRGDAISSVASLSLDQLRDRISGTELPGRPGVAARPCHLLVIGPSLAECMPGAASAVQGIVLTGAYDSRASFLQDERPRPAPDLLVFESPTVHGDQVRELTELVTRSGAARAILVYNFASRGTIERLASRRILARRAPVDPEELCGLCLGHRVDAPAAPAERPEVDLAQPICPRRFKDADLLRIATTSTSVRCECPRHLVGLVQALNAFETYSEECEVRNAEDAALHAYLHAVTAHARATMEAALTRVVAAEGIEIDVDGGEI